MTKEDIYSQLLNTL